MPKRMNPFIEDYIPQSKIHMSLKQFNNNEDRKQKVYEKTLELLYKGAKKSHPRDVILNKTEINITDRKTRLKQLFIGQNGTLLHSGNIVHGNISNKQCKCGSESESKCSYCELLLCLSCQHLCSQCDQAYCTTCMLIGLEGSEVCVSCYS